MKNFILIFNLAIASISFGQTTNNCDAIILHGLRNISVSMGSDVLTSRTYSNNCHKDFSTLTDEQIGAAEIEAFGYVKGTINYSRKQRETALTEWCKTNENEVQFYSSKIAESNLIYGRAYDAYEKCIELQTDKIQFDYQPSEDYMTINISMRYNDPSSGNGIYLTGVEAEGFEYKIRYVNREDKISEISKLPEDSPVFINNLATNIIFKRNKPDSVVFENESYLKLNRGTITIQTSGKSISLFYPEEIKSQIPNFYKLQDQINQKTQEYGIGGIGSIEASLLTEGEFKKLYNSNGQEWVLAKGQKISENSRYFILTKKDTLPDMRGMFLRGKNYDRKPEDGNVDKDLELGKIQKEALNLSFNILGPTRNGYKTLNNSGSGDDVRIDFDFKNEEKMFGNETRPKNVTVNYFIRIN